MNILYNNQEDIASKIKKVISAYKKKQNDKKIHIIFDHIFSHDNYNVFMISMIISKQEIPLWFRCFKGNKDCNAFKEPLLKEGISYVSNLFNKTFDLIFLPTDGLTLYH